jgi:hypothetical protein
VKVGRRSWKRRRLANVTSEGDKAILIGRFGEVEVTDRLLSKIGIRNVMSVGVLGYKVGNEMVGR